MTVVAVLADPPRPGLALPELAEESPLSEADAADLYAALLKDTFRAVERSGADLLVNYRPDDLLPDEHVTETASEVELRTLAGDALADVPDARFEQQVGSTVSARAGNTATHLLREEGAHSVAVVRGTAPLLTRSAIDSAAMKLRSNATVLGPSTRGRTYFAGYTAPVDYEDAFGDDEVETLTRRAADADHDVEFLPLQVAVETTADLRDLLPVLWARVAAERVVPEHTTSFVHDRGLRVRDGELVADG
ncbi:hypothetical protein [Candidatus Halobonum tyrrellensis]|uniref:DUF2064 domain-containing protein n=1 Tax=Candidatus Halobonum tyrrellensis G22 TaxID=1324957 RepID=V4HH81_9EURY|nr:hypothetical protein [Candidatus Halobonum tyrrellensis]ESP87229.1 hypothetical protein K933_15229 [Candidatus Halobonum tyrrellensis G22]